MQVVVPDELEQLGIEQLVKSRGAKVLSFDRVDLSTDDPQSSPIDSKADVIVLAAETSRDVRNEMPRLIGLVNSAARKSKILAISSIRFKAENSDLLNQITGLSSAVLIRTDRIDSEDLLKSILSLELGSDDFPEVTLSSSQIDRVMETAERIPNLTNREHQILSNVAKGISNRQIADQLGLSLRTVNNHVGMTFLKLGINSDDNINGRVTASLAFYLFNRAIVKYPEDVTIPEPDDPVYVSTEFHSFVGAFASSESE